MSSKDVHPKPDGYKEWILFIVWKLILFLYVIMEASSLVIFYSNLFKLYLYKSVTDIQGFLGRGKDTAM